MTTSTTVETATTSELRKAARGTSPVASVARAELARREAAEARLEAVARAVRAEMSAAGK